MESFEASQATIISTFKEYEARDFVEEFSTILGQGGMGVVYKKRTIDNETVAVKDLRPRRFVKLELLHRVSQKEVQFLRDCQHSNIVKMLGTVKSEHSDAYDAIVFEYHDEGSLENVIMGKKEKGIIHHLIYDQRHILLWATQLTTALVYLHEKGLVHNDLKPDNVLMADNYRTVKLADLGSTRPHGISTDSVFYTKRYKAPDRGVAGRTHASNDVYALGLILWQLNYRQKPFFEYETEDQIQIASCYTRPKLTGCNEVLKAMIRRCWDQILLNCWDSKELLSNLSTWLKKILDRSGNVISPPVPFEGLALTLPPESGILKFPEYTPPPLPDSLALGGYQPMQNSGKNDAPMDPSRQQKPTLQIGNTSIPLGRDAIIGIEYLCGILKLSEIGRRDLRGPDGPGRGQVREVEKTVEKAFQAFNNFYRETTPRTKPENYKYREIEDPD